MKVVNRTQSRNVWGIASMKRVLSLLLVCVLLVCTGCFSAKQPVKPVTGRYYLDKEGSTSYIEVFENNDLLFSGVSFTDMEENFYEKVAVALFDQKNKENGISLTDEERDARVREIREGIDLNKQFSDKPSPFEFVGQRDEYGFTAAVNGSTLWLVIMYRPDELALICNEHKYVLREGA